MVQKDKSHRKSVSFEKGETSEAQGSKNTREGNNRPTESDPSMLKICFHSLANIFLMFKMGITDDPVRTMVKGFCTLLIFEFAYSYLIKNIHSNRKKSKKDTKSALWFALFASTIMSLMASIVIFVTLVLLGAPLATNLKETLLLGMHLSFLSVFPVLIDFDFAYGEIMALISSNNYLVNIISNQVLSSSILAFIGAWIGVIPIPLDWERPWQQWPITLLIGGYLGNFAGSVLSLFCN